MKLYQLNIMGYLPKHSVVSEKSIKDSVIYAVCMRVSLHDGMLSIIVIRRELFEEYYVPRVIEG